MLNNQIVCYSTNGKPSCIIAYWLMLKRFGYGEIYSTAIKYFYFVFIFVAMRLFYVVIDIFGRC